jgi:hypothetical protein
MVTATTGQKAGLSTTPDSQIKQILETAAIALRKVSADLEAEREADSNHDALPWYKKLFYKMEKLEKELPQDDGVKDHSDLPIVIIDNYLYRESSVNSVLWNE